MKARDRSRLDLRGLLAPGAALLLVVSLVVFILLLQETPDPNAEPMPSPTSADEHEVTTDEGVLSFRLEGDAIVVRIETASGISELGRATLPNMVATPPSGPPAPTGTALFILACGAPDSPDARRYVFGHMDATDGDYTGPEAVGHVASDGLFLFAIRPGAEADAITIETEGGSGGSPADIFLQATQSGTAQPSGCFVLT